jgi:putative transposase
MGWKETCPMTERMQFLADVQSGELSFSEACRRRGISRKTGYKLWSRFQSEGVAALAERSRAPQRHPHAVEAAVVAKLIGARQAHPYWGPRNLIDWLERREPGSRWPAPSTVGELLKRHGLVSSRRRRRHSPPYSTPFVAADRPNALWSIDFKGQFRLGDGSYCYPLTVSDGFSRYLLLCRGLASTAGAPVRVWLERTFREYGLPVAIRSHNGAPRAPEPGVGPCTMTQKCYPCRRSKLLPIYPAAHLQEPTSRRAAPWARGNSPAPRRPRACARAWHQARAGGRSLSGPAPPERTHRP